MQKQMQNPRQNNNKSEVTTEEVLKTADFRVSVVGKYVSQVVYHIPFCGSPMNYVLLDRMLGSLQSSLPKLGSSLRGSRSNWMLLAFSLAWFYGSYDM